MNGDLVCTGNIAAAVHASSRKVALNTISSPEHWFEDAGSGQLSNGEAVVNIETVFGETVNTGVEYHRVPHTEGRLRRVLPSAMSTATGFEVHELRNGHSSIAFDYRIMAKRVGYEKVGLADLTEQLNKQAAYRQKMRRPRPTGTRKASPRMPTPPVLPARAALQPLAVQPR